MKQIVLFISLIFSISIVHSKNVTVAGDWLLTKMESTQGVKKVYAPISFQPNGDFLAMEMKMGTWKYDKKSKTVKIISERFKAANGDNKVTRLDNKGMVLENNGTKMYFLRMEKEKILDENNNSGLMGAWKLKSSDPKIVRFITFSPPDNFSYVEKEPGVTTSGKGTWIFNKKDNSVILIARIEGLDHNYSVKELSESGFILENENGTFKANKAKSDANIEHLSFKSDDFYDSDGNFKYEDEEGKLPWNDTYAMIKYLQSIHQLTYEYSSLVKDVNVFQNKRLIARVQADENEGKACVDFIFSGYDKDHLPEDSQLPPNCISIDDNYNKLFPEKEVDYRVTGKSK